MAATTTTTTNRSLTIRQVEGRPGQVYYPLQLHTAPLPQPGPDEVLVRLHAAALNHRDLFLRQHLYPGLSFASPLLADGCGTVVAVGPGSGPAAAALRGRRVLLTPSRGWAASPDGPEGGAGGDEWATVGGVRQYPRAGTAQDYVVAPAAEAEPLPPHLSPVEGAALPLVGLTAWRALVTKTAANAAPGRNLLITGIGGGVALQALQFAVALGCHVWVTSGDDAKIARACQMGARGGVSYKDKAWDKSLAAMLPADRPFLDAVVDGAGGDVVAKTVRLLRPGGIISSYGMTLAPKMDWLMQAVFKNIELRGSTMGSRAEFRDMVAFVDAHKIKPVISRTVQGLDNLDAIDGLFDDMKAGRQFGKLVIEISPHQAPEESKL